MTIAQKIKLIQKLSGLTQDKLAQKLGVSFATLNSWLNEHSEPRKKAGERIDELYREYTGQKTIPADVLSAKKQIIISRQKGHANVLKEIVSNPDIYDQFVLSLTYNSNRIEGSTLSEPETAAILFDNVALPNKSLIEQLEVKNHQAALKFLFSKMGDPINIDEQLVLKLHSILMNGILDDAGIYRHHAVRIAGANVPMANYIKIPELMAELIKDVRKTAGDTVAHVCQIHSRFEQIHPFSDGNGRIGRLLMHAMTLHKNIPPSVISEQKRQLYYLYLNKAQQGDDSSQLEDFVCDAILTGFDILERK